MNVYKILHTSGLQWFDRQRPLTSKGSWQKPSSLDISLIFYLPVTSSLVLNYKQNRTSISVISSSRLFINVKMEFWFIDIGKAKGFCHDCLKLYLIKWRLSLSLPSWIKLEEPRRPRVNLWTLLCPHTTLAVCLNRL